MIFEEALRPPPPRARRGLRIGVHWCCGFGPILLLLCLLIGPSLASGQPPASPRAAEIHQRLQAILARPEYAPQPGGATLAERMGEAIRRVLERFFRSLTFEGPISSSGTLITYVLMVALVAGLLAAVAHAAVLVLRRARLRTEASRGQRDPLHDEVEVEAMGSDPESLLRAARAARSRGDLEKAYRLYFLALLFRLDAAGLIRYDRSRTNGDYLRALRGSTLTGRLRAAMSAFDSIRYGGRRIDERDLETVAALLESLTMPVSTRASG